jgi:hypothetical protein
MYVYFSVQKKATDAQIFFCENSCRFLKIKFITENISQLFKFLQNIIFEIQKNL